MAISAVVLAVAEGGGLLNKGLVIPIVPVLAVGILCFFIGLGVAQGSQLAWYGFLAFVICAVAAHVAVVVGATTTGRGRDE